MLLSLLFISLPSHGKMARLVKLKFEDSLSLKLVQSDLAMKISLLILAQLSISTYILTKKHH